MAFKNGQIAEYGSKEFNENRAVYTILDKGIIKSGCGVEFQAELYHRTQGFCIAGSCGVYHNEVWGYRLYFNDGTTGGNMYSSEAEALKAWEAKTKN